MYQMPDTVRVVLEYQERYRPAGFILLRREGLYARDALSLPGGRISDGENPLEAAIRRVKEETSLHLARIQIRPFHEETLIAHPHQAFTNTPSITYVVARIVEEHPYKTTLTSPDAVFAHYVPSTRKFHVPIDGKDHPLAYPQDLIAYSLLLSEDNRRM